MGQVRTPIKQDDIVQVIAGKERGKSGKVLNILPNNRALVEKLNIVKRHARPSNQNRQGGIVEKESSIHLSNMMVVCPACSKPTRVKAKWLKDGKKVRACRKCDEILDK